MSNLQEVTDLAFMHLTFINTRNKESVRFILSFVDNLLNKVAGFVD